MIIQFSKLLEMPKKKFCFKFFFKIIVNEFSKRLLLFLILNYFSLNHVLISHGLYKIIFISFISIYYHDILKNHLYFLIPAFFLILSLLFYLEILEFNFCNLNKNTKRNIMLRQEEEMLIRNNSNISDIEIDNDLIIKNLQEEKELELSVMADNSEEKDNNNDNKN